MWARGCWMEGGTEQPSEPPSSYLTACTCARAEGPQVAGKER